MSLNPRLRYFFLQPSQEGPSGFEYAGPDIVKGTLEGVCSLRGKRYDRSSSLNLLVKLFYTSWWHRFQWRTLRISGSNWGTPYLILPFGLRRMVSPHAKNRKGRGAELTPSRHAAGQSQVGDLFL